MQVEQRSSFVERSEVLHYLTCWITDKRGFPKTLTLEVLRVFFPVSFFLSQAGVIRRKRTKKKK